MTEFTGVAPESLTEPCGSGLGHWRTNTLAGGVAAIASAVADALDIDIREIPMTPEKPFRLVGQPD